MNLPLFSVGRHAGLNVSDRNCLKRIKRLFQLSTDMDFMHVEFHTLLVGFEKESLVS